MLIAGHKLPIIVEESVNYTGDGMPLFTYNTIHHNFIDRTVW